MIYIYMARHNGKTALQRIFINMQIHQMREQVSKVYSGPGWKRQVQKMPDDQVIALWHKFKQEGRIK